jgi:hypothetical protein
MEAETETGREAIKLTDAELAEDAVHLRERSVDAAEVIRGGGEVQARITSAPGQ